MATDARDARTDARLEVAVSASPGRQRQGKFQPFKRLFGKKKKSGPERERELHTSFSTEEVNDGVVTEGHPDQHLRELTPIGTRALSHDSVFIQEEAAREGCPEHAMSQENVSDKVRSLQKQIAQGIKFGQKPPSPRKSEDDPGSSDEGDWPQSPLEVLPQVEAEPDHIVHGDSLVQGFHRGERHTTPVKSPRSKCVLPATGTIESINLDSVPQSVPRLDNTAAKHKLSVKPKNQRVSRKHRKFTPNLHDVSPPPVLHEETEDRKNLEEPRSRRERSPFDSPDSSHKQRPEVEDRLESGEKREKVGSGEEPDEERRKRAEELLEIGERCRTAREEDRGESAELERRKRDEEDRKIREEERAKREEEERRVKEEEARAQREKEERIREEEERRRREDEERRRAEEQRRREEEEKMAEAERLRVEEENRLREKAEQEEKRRTIREGERQREQEEKRRQEAEEEETNSRGGEEEPKTPFESEGAADPVARKRKAEELRWREMEERQRPFSFKVSSGEKQILFQKVNLTPVTLPSSQQEGTVADPRVDSKASPGGAESHSLSSHQYVPHTAILVTGAQLCGPAVNLDQIKDTACKSLLGLGEDKKGMKASPTKSKNSPERKSGKTKSLSESSSSDQSSAAILAEWASIRSKIFKAADDGKYEGYPDPVQSPTRIQSGTSGEDPDQNPFAHSNLRKTMSASAKFSITPAKKKFADSSRTVELSCPADKDRGMTENQSDVSSGTAAPDGKAQSKATKAVRIADRSEGCQFAKDLPSFLVPNPDQDSIKHEGPGGVRSPEESEESDESGEGEKMGPDDQNRPSPFGIKLRKTNYSLRFQGEQPTEKRKKRYSAGDTFDGVPPPLAPIEPDSSSSSASPLRESSPVLTAASSSVTRAKRVGAFSAGENTSPKPLYHRTSAAPKIPCADASPPLPLLKVAQGCPGEAGTQRTGLTTDLADQGELGKRKDGSSAVAQLLRGSQGEEEPKEKRSFFPSISIPWREKADRKTELIKREKPSLQSRHSLDSARLQEKDAGPLWITLALQKQKGFREQQQTRDDRRSQREAKLAEKLARETSGSVNSSSESKRNINTSPKPPQTPEVKRPDTLLACFERRDNLKKANTLPSSVTVEISDSPPLSPAVKDVSKRFPSSDSPQTSTEPAWLALAKRKAKAWSDCPQIIK